MSRFILKAAIYRALKKPAGKVITVIGEDAGNNDCYVIKVKSSADHWVGVVTSANSKGISCVGGEGNKEDRQILWSNTSVYDVEIKHYYKHFTFKYDAPSKLLVWEWSNYFKWIVRREKISQYIYSKRRLVRVGRIDVLRHFVHEEITVGGYQQSPVNLVDQLHSIRAFGRSDIDEQIKYYELICDSFVSTGEMSCSGISYQITPKAIATLSSYEEEERKHQEMRRIQVFLGIFAAGSLLVGLLQAYVAYVKK